MDLNALLLRKSVEDLVLSRQGVAYFEAGHWSGPVLHPACAQEALERLILQIGEAAGLTLGWAQPSADAFLEPLPAQVFRAHVVLPPLSPEGPVITLRRVTELANFSLQDFSLSEEERAHLESACREGKSLLIAGATGSGKSSFLSALLNEVPQNQRLLILEDSPELPLPHALATKLLSRTDRFGNRAGSTWDLTHLLFESLRMRPDRIVLGECRGSEAKAVALALKTGHRGVMTTLHAGSVQQALSRFAELAQRSPEERLWDGVVVLELDNERKRRLREARFLWTVS